MEVATINLSRSGCVTVSRSMQSRGTQTRRCRSCPGTHATGRVTSIVALGWIGNSSGLTTGRLARPRGATAGRGEQLPRGARCTDGRCGARSSVQPPCPETVSERASGTPPQVGIDLIELVTLATRVMPRRRSTRCARPSRCDVGGANLPPSSIAPPSGCRRARTNPLTAATTRRCMCPS